ncbi:hypothetical protein BKA67DRAFT_663752 [Truncatella angustata]|uniref:Uncharacterized protein n=1 Tax=Truncatella angustata TaxID=152316 RepID=A0A9P8RH16_9PEZI|nr:uncharacterized protein BKA67DRAFT_663752 [Truncatella angustata]KAH6645873.1 hypothetical protein BKA67DRAFT_663752 [Truncatella angustata]KAH8205260.1 hypothetical protein TruAng_000507 [Truncatella angustata]
MATGVITTDCHGAGRGHCHSSDWEDGTAKHLASSKHRLKETEGFSLSRLENLPAELRTLLLLSMPDLPTLRSLVRASPILHAQYLDNRNNILSACLDYEVDGFLIDAYATAMSRARELGSPRTDKNITDFLSTYQAWLSGSTPVPDIKSIHASRIRWLAAYHLSVARPLAHLYSNWALANLNTATLSSTGQQGAAAVAVEEVASPAQDEHDVELSRSEERRVFRALYRFETYQHLFGQNQAPRHGSFRHHEINDWFFCIFDPWEAEAIGCIDIFVRLRYEDTFNEINKDLHPRNARFRLENGVYNPEGSYDLEMEHDSYMDGTVSRGLKMTARLLGIDDHEKLVSEMQRCLTHYRDLDAPVRSALGSEAQNDRREMSTNFPNTRDEAEQRRDPINFIGDTAPPDGLPIAWVLLWGGKYANIYGEYVPQSVRRWGYVMWDERRWADMGAKDLVARQWESSPELVDEIENDYWWSPVAR